MVNKVLFLMEKYCDANPACGPTNTESVIGETIKSTWLVRETKRFYFDVLCQQLGKERMIQLLLEDCEVFEPDLIIYSACGGPLGEQLNPPDNIFSCLRSKGIKVLTCLWDSVSVGPWDSIAREEIKWSSFSNFIGIWDSIVPHLKYQRNPKIIQAYSAVDPKNFHNKNLERDIDISFIGSVDLIGARWPGRIQYINFLRSNGVNVFVAGGQRQGRLSWEDYSNFLNRSKISLSWSIDPRLGTCQLKGRVFEVIACGAMLMEDNGDQTRRLFEPGKDFIMFSSPIDLLRKVHYYLEHDEEREAVAKSGCKKVSDIYNACNMWGYIFEKIGFKAPEWLAKDRNYLIHNEILNMLGCTVAP